MWLRSALHLVRKPREGFLSGQDDGDIAARIDCPPNMFEKTVAGAGQRMLKEARR
jgi:hypothetical protein